MPSILTTSGAQFYRADLHIHSHGPNGSYDVTDTTMTPENIVDTALSQNLRIISITDHNEIGNVQKAIDHSLGKNILVIPGIEVTTTQGHLLLYFDSFINLRNFFGKLTITTNRELCQQGIVECLNFAEQFGGIGVLAHIELNSGFEETIGRFGPQIEEILCHKNLQALEISSKNNINRYTDRDDSADRKRLINSRREKLATAEDCELPMIMSSDAHSLGKLGLNAEGDKKLTRLKMDVPSFHGFKIALINYTSRVRIETVIPEKIPKVKSIILQGGLLDSQTVNFSSNLTCIIGGRGTGKSTLLECLRTCSGNSSNSNVIDSDVWPQVIDLIYEDETGREIQLSRQKNSLVTNIKSPQSIVSFKIECYGQGATAETIQHSESDPSSLLSFLDTFIELKPLQVDDEILRQKLLDNQSEKNRLRIEVANIPATKQHKENIDAKLEQLKKDNVGELVKYQTALFKEQELRQRIIKELTNLAKTYRTILDNQDVFKEFEHITDDEIVIGKTNFIEVRRIVKEFSTAVSTQSGELKIILDEKIKELNEQLKAWAGKETDILKTIDEKKTELAKKGIPFDIGKINQIAKDSVYYRQRLTTLEGMEKKLTELNQERLVLLRSRKEIKEKIYQTRLAFSILVNENLKNSVDGFFVNLKYLQGKYSPVFEETLKNTMQWRTSQVPRTRLVSQTISPLEFSLCARKKNFDFLKLVIDDSKNRIFQDNEISNILTRVRESNNFEDFEALEYEDLPILTVTKLIQDQAGNKKPVSRKLSQLSLGQQQSILLAILLLSKSNVPLLIDQPEDNLDSEFVYKTIVSNLRKIKERRQVIIVTHNANIAVLGDAELIIPLKGSNTRSIVKEAGSIDRAETICICCDILEGGRSAFQQRMAIYGI